MNHRFLKPRQAINKAFLKVKPVRIQIEVFKGNLIRLLDQINETESEEFHKNLVSDFLKRTYYEPDFSIKKNSLENQSVFIAFVDNILKRKEQDPTTDTTDLENQIDQLVYELYGLTEEEIRIVEGGDG